MEESSKKEWYFELKPNLKKVFFSNFLKVISVAFLIVIIFYFTIYLIGLETSLMPFEVFNVEVDTLKIVYIFIAAVFCIALVASALNYFSVKGVKYGLYKNRLKIYRTAFFLLLSSKEVSYENVFRVTYNNKGFFNKLFKSGCVVLELSGTKNKEAKLEFIDNPLKVSEYIQKLIQNYRQMQQAVFDERHKIESILDQV